MEKRFVFLISLIVLLEIIFLSQFILAESILEQHGISQTTPQPQNSPKTGARIQTNVFGSTNITLYKVSFGSTSTGTTAYL